MGPLARRFPLLSPGLLVRRKAISQGFFGDSRVWQVIGVVVFGRTVLRKIMGAGSETVAVERIRPGERIILTGVRLKK